jgi:branched-chain amino acid transport system substrate-binding protein
MKIFERKEILWIVIFISGITALAGCNDKQKTKPSGPVKIGVIVPLSGNDGVLGDFTLKGLQLAVDEQNSAGGLLKRKIELDIRDSKGDVKEGEILIKEMMGTNDKPIMVYAIISGVSLAIKPVTEENKTILMAAVGSDQFLQESNYTVRNYVSASTIGKSISQFLKDSMDVSNLTVFYSDNAYGKSVKDAVLANCTELNMNVITEPFKADSTDKMSIISAGINKNTECVFVTGIGIGLGTMFKQIIASGYNGKIVNDMFVPYPDVQKAAGNALKGIRYLDFAFDPGSENTTTREFVKGFENKFNITPQNFSVITYDGVKLLFSTIEKSGTFNPDTLVANLNKVQDYQGVFGQVSVAERNMNFKMVFKTWGK